VGQGEKVHALPGWLLLAEDNFMVLDLVISYSSTNLQKK